MTWRKKWAKNWAEVKYCSDACRKDAGSEIAARLERAVIDLLRRRKADATICPSEAARLVDPAHWADLMEPARRAARRLARAGRIVITQGGKVVDPATIRGPIRLRFAK